MSGKVHVHYGQTYIECVGDEDFCGDVEACFAGQANGLVGVARAGGIFLTTGLHTGHVPFTVELHDQRPALDEAWQEIVEVSFRPTGSVSLVSWGGEESWELGLDQADYRVRYSATGMDEAREQDTRLDDDPVLDRYLVQFWPGPPEPDRVVKQTSEQAAYWHSTWASTP